MGLSRQDPVKTKRIPRVVANGRSSRTGAEDPQRNYPDWNSRVRHYGDSLDLGLEWAGVGGGRQGSNSSST